MFKFGKSTISMGHFPVRFLYVYQAGYLVSPSRFLRAKPSHRQVLARIAAQDDGTNSGYLFNPAVIDAW